MYTTVVMKVICLGSVSKDFTKDEMREILLNVVAYDFSIDRSPTEKGDILNIHEYLIKKNNTEQCLD